MKRIVFCWEMGDNYGHIAGFLPLYHGLRRQGIEVFLVLRHTTYAHLLGNDAPTFCFQAPSPHCALVPRELYSYVDILACIGYLNEPVLLRYVTDWCDLLQHIRPDLVLADHAPTALLAAKVLQLPTAALGTGFTSPPTLAVFPPFFPNRLPPDDTLSSQILAVTNRVLQQLQAATLDRLEDILTATKLFLCTFSELDHYGSRATANYYGTLFSDNMGAVFEWPSLNEPRIFAYLTPKVSQLSKVLADIAQLPGHKLLHLPGVNSELLAGYRNRTDLTLAPAPLKLGPLLQTLDLVIGQGGLGLSSQCVIRGVKQVLIPTQMEQRMLTRQLVTQRLAYAIDPKRQEPPMAKVFAQALTCTTLAQHCAATRLKYADFSQEKQIEAIVQAICIDA